MENQICNKCKATKNISAFSWRRAGKKHTICKDCYNTLRKEYYKANKEKELQRTYKARNENFPKVIEYLKKHPCVDCGSTDIVVLQFDHVRGEKKKAVTILMRSHSWSIVKEEIDKCDVRCANCHTRKTAERGGWRRFLLSSL